MSSSILGTLRAAREWATPTLKTSAFLEKGVITPEEFVQAGDELVYRCPTWAWASGEPSKQKPYLPPDKQYLITRNVPCQQRVSDIEQNFQLDEAADNDDWLVSRVAKPTDIEDEFDILDEQGEVVEKQEETQEEEEYADLETYEDDNVLTDDCVADTTQDNLVKVRTYDLSITYDKYYQTPRVWMVGTYNGQPLSGKQMMEDVYLDYAQKTVTIEAHPHVSGPHASIHPCQHGKVMKTIVHNLISANKEQGDETAAPSVEMYLFIFLKFISSMIPTINYDFTMDVTANVTKH